MKKLVVILLACLVATSAFAATDPGTNSFGIYFDTEGISNCTDAAAMGMFNAYFILVNPTVSEISFYEFSYLNVVPAGMEGMLFKMGSTSIFDPDGMFLGNATGALSGDYIATCAYPVATAPVTILASHLYMLMAAIPVEMYVDESSMPSLPGAPCIDIVATVESDFIPLAWSTGGGAGTPVATVNGECVVGVEEASFGSVKSLFR